ncbi:YecA family protein [Pseudomonas aeruginosa]|nr:YecA family protein [Pseudomonas aeruginosa]MEB4883158.1 YecA family protein [Pseudomonas aeruginosa]
MSTQNSAYSAFFSLLAEAAMPVSPAELHGHLLGRVCAGAGFDEAAWQHAAAELLGGAPGERLKAALSGLLGMVRQDFSAGEVAVVMLLPDDETPLAQRTEALGQWCQGFLAGFGLTAREGSLTGEAEEVLQDMAAIAQVQGQLEDSEDGETDYMEVMEYLRVAPLLLFAECGKPLEPAPKPSLH